MAQVQAKASLLLNLLALGNFVVGMGAFVVIGVVTPIAEDLHVSKADASIILTSYALAYAVLSPIGAAITGNLPRRTVLTGALAMFCLGTILSALAWSLPLLTASRVLVAFGAALYTPMS
ncbi:MFS transporter, partial [Aestuariivirga sp.]|uniref:MFS transporter n=1 Tax=Aestuariivirga sp. TaxID=2650926 RepID=UPI003592F0C7